MLVAAATASSAERLLASAEEAARLAALVGVAREWSASWWVAAAVAELMGAGGSTVWTWDSRWMARLMMIAAAAGVSGGAGCASVASLVSRSWGVGGGGEGARVGRRAGGWWVAAA